MIRKSPKRRRSPKKKSYKIRGGEVLGRGGYGCVIEIDEKTVGKINYGNFPMYEEFGIKSLKEFMTIQQTIHSSDPSEKYFITTREVKQMNKNDPRIFDCVENDNKQVDFYDVFLQSKVEKPPSVYKWSELQINHAISGLKLLHTTGFVHNDVSKNNFGFKNDMPVYIDMDGASYARPVRTRKLKRGFVVDLNETPEFDFQQLNKVFRE